jgi:hypothetical protein
MNDPATPPPRDLAVLLLAALAIGGLAGAGLASIVVAHGGGGIELGSLMSKVAASRDWNKTFENIKNGATAVAILVGGFWAYFKYFKGRTFLPQLELTVSGTQIVHSDAKFLIARMTIKNIGLSKVTFGRAFSRLEVSLFVPAAYAFLYGGEGNVHFEEVQSPIWKPQPPARFGVFQNHVCVEPNETIFDELLVALPPTEQLAYRLELRVTTPEPLIRKGKTWTATAIVHVEPPGKSEEIDVTVHLV